MNSRVIILIFSTINYFSINNAIKISQTTSGKTCMTECVPYKNYHYCYLGWGQNYWDYCTPGKEVSKQYFSAMVKGPNSFCASLCTGAGYNYNWCFTGANGNWDYCSKTPGMSMMGNKCVQPCTKFTFGYNCWTGSKYETCSPDPFDVSTLITEIEKCAKKISVLSSGIKMDSVKNLID